MERPTAASAADAGLVALEKRLREAAARQDDPELAGSSAPGNTVAILRDAGWLGRPAPRRFGGEGMGTEPAGAHAAIGSLRFLGSCSLSAGRLFEGHINALQLVERYGTESQKQRAARDARDGHLFAIWVTDGREPLRMEQDADGRVRLSGEKPFASGAGLATRPLVTATPPAGEPRMLVVPLAPRTRATPLPTPLAGMRAAATGGMDLSGLALDADALVGEAGDYLRQPLFSAGAWRASAVALGGIDRLASLFCEQLRARNRDGSPHQRRRIGEVLIARETAAMWVRRAALVAENFVSPDSPDAATDVAETVNLARIACERAALDVLERVQRGLGLQAFGRGTEVERVARDLATFLRQPAPDETLDEAAGWFVDRPIPDPHAGGSADPGDPSRPDLHEAPPVIPAAGSGTGSGNADGHPGTDR
ncbi:acyl-CoA dehydrogenase family protein [Rhizosaccharibacter radicis]|uniref:Acyl-CoA/acyl-ACP dehydrogenase n=1 Tax=Rhizosaccharibacter radicis TaxID=2782605 RepID=A0ABT1VVN4_9PROT|nr:acyl-CoA/acyl-ACP dehydrogenase [Acetobacteraceae bacterium KSS12]